MSQCTHQHFYMSFCRCRHSLYILAAFSPNCLSDATHLNKDFTFNVDNLTHPEAYDFTQLEFREVKQHKDDLRDTDNVTGSLVFVEEYQSSLRLHRHV